MTVSTLIATQVPPPRAIGQLARPNILKLSPYQSNRDSAEADGLIFLDANENPFGNYNRYPDGNQAKLKAKIGMQQSIPESQIFLGNGSDEIIDLCFRIFCRPGIDKAVTYGPTFSMYKVAAQLNDVSLVELPLDGDFQPDPELLRPFLNDESAKLLLLCSPNNPTGNSFEQLEALVQSFRGIVLIDEAYIDFSERPSFINKLSTYPNLMICQTFSKGRSLAGARVGIAFAGGEIIRLLNMARMPYNVSALNQAAALVAMDEEVLYRQRINAVLAERERLIVTLSGSPLLQNIYPTDANFILVRVADAKWLCEALKQRGILVRDQSSAITNCIRISIGTAGENDLLIAAFDALSKQINA